MRSPAGLALALAVLAAGCGVRAESQPRTLDPGSVPFRSIGQSPTAAPVGAGRALVYLVRDGAIVAVVRRFPEPPTPEAVLAALVVGPSGRESDAGLTTAVLPGTTFDKQGIAAGVAYVDVPASSTTESGRNDEVLAHAQVVVTLTALPAVTGVRFLRDGQPLDVPRADGSLARVPLTRRDYTALL
jgi:spore germination protein GerM